MSGSKFRNFSKTKPKKGIVPKHIQFSGTQINTSSQLLLEQAIGLHVKNELDLAKPIYQEILNSQPNHFDALHYLGVVHYQQGEPIQALALIEQAIKIHPDHSVCQSNLGNVYQSLNRFDQAIFAYTKSLELNPQFYDAYFNLGVVTSAAPDTDQRQKALECYNRALLLNPSFASAHNNRGLTLQALYETGVLPQGFELACIDYELATQLNPGFVQAFFNWGVALQGNHKLDKALEKYNTCIDLDPQFALAFNNRGNLLQALGKYDEALQSFTKALELDPNLAEAFYNRGSLYQTLEFFDAAKLDYDLAILKNPEMVEAFFNRASVFEQLKNFDSAKFDFQKAIALRPDFANAHFNLSLLHLKLQAFSIGWQMYEWRWLSDDFLGKYLKTSKPLWTKESDTQKIFIWNEQGVGDEIFFLPWLIEFSKLISAHNFVRKSIICRVDSRLINLFKRSIPELQFVAREFLVDDSSYDAHMPMGSLPLAVMQLNQMSEAVKGNTLTPKPNPVAAYLLSDEDRAASFKSLLSGPEELLIGISWRSKNPKTGAPRSLNLADLVQSLNMPRIRLVNLQYGDVQSELIQVSSKVGVVQQAPNLDAMQDLDALASLIKACDLVISADNTTVHLSGALGKETLVLLPYTSDWRWGEGFEDATCYHRVKLIRQQNRGDWQPVFEVLREIVMQLIAEKS